MNHPFNIHRPFLDALRREGTPVVIYLVNGVKLEGEIDSFDDAAVILRRGGYQDASQGSAAAQKRMIFRHAISTVFPLGPVHFSPEGRRPAREPYENRGYSGPNRRRYPPQVRTGGGGGGGYSRQRPPEPGNESRDEYSENYRTEPDYQEAPVSSGHKRHWSEEQE